MSTNPESHPVGQLMPTVDVAPHSRFQSVLDAGKNLTIRTVAVIGIAASAITAESAVTPPAAVADTGGYPDSDATDCSAIFGTYSWCKDENGNHSFGNGEQWSGRGYDYRNCTVTMLVGTPDGSDAWVQLSHKTGLNGPQLWWDGAGYMFDGIKPVMGDVNADGTDDLVLATRQADGSTAVSPLLSTGTGYWLQSPWWTDVYTDWTHMTPTIGNFTGSRHNTRPIADFGFIAPTTNGVRAWVLPSTRTGLQSAQSWRIMNGWGWSGVKMGRNY